MREGMEKQIFCYIARDEGYNIYERRHDYSDSEFGIWHTGDLHLFYDTPQYTGHDNGGEFVDENGETLWRDDHRFFKLARKCCSIPSYMFPEVKDGQCYELRSDALLTKEVINMIKERWKKEDNERKNRNEF